MNKTYYDEFLRYYELAALQQKECNLGITPHKELDIKDDLMMNVELYDVVERKYAGFSQIVHDIVYQKSVLHPYYKKISMGLASKERMQMIENWHGRNHTKLNWLWLFLMHRVTGSAINYGKNPSGYHNTLLWHLHDCRDLQDFISCIWSMRTPFYTSIGYQFPAFPKHKDYKRGGDNFLINYAPRLVYDVLDWLTQKNTVDFREIGEYMFDWNKKQNLRAYKFQYSAFIADIADWMPEYINRASPFYYGTNAKECISYISGSTKEKDLDKTMQRIYDDTGAYPYNAEDVCCDFIRWVENYINPNSDYAHLDRDKVWSSCTITNHAKGRQKAMLEHGLVKTFNDFTTHPSDYKVLDSINMSVQDYKQLVN